MNLSDVASVLRDQAACAARGEEAGDVVTLARTMERLCIWYAGQFETTGKMTDTEAILTRCAACFAGADDADVFCDLARGLERYLVQLMFWVDRQLPWSAVSDLVHGYRLPPSGVCGVADCARGSSLPRNLLPGIAIRAR